jgi:hypothetical protein
MAKYYSTYVRLVIYSTALVEKEPLLHPSSPGSTLEPRLNTTEFRAFAESEVPLGEGCIPLVEGFTERKLSAKTSQRSSTSKDVCAESMQDPSVNTKIW